MADCFLLLKVLLELRLQPLICTPSESVFSFLSVLIWEAQNIINRSAQLPPATSWSSLQTQSARGVDHRSLHSRWSWCLKTNMPLWYHLICSAPLSAKISFIPPTVAARTPPSEPDVLPPSLPFEVKACALRQRVNVSHCYGVTGLHSRLFDPVLDLKSFFKKKKKNNLETYELRGSGDRLCHPSFHSNVFLAQSRLLALAGISWTEACGPKLQRSQTGTFALETQIHF